MTIVGIEDEYIASLPLYDEHGYPLLTNENGEEILDDWGEPIRTGFGTMQVEEVEDKHGR